MRWHSLGVWTAGLWLAACELPGRPAEPRARVEQVAAPPRAASDAAAPRPGAAPGPQPKANSNPGPATRPRAAPQQPASAEVSADASAATAALAAMPETRAVAASFRPFSAQAQSQALAAQRNQRGLAGVRSARSPLSWSPPRGEKVVVVSGDTPQGALLVAYHPLPAGGARLAASYQTRGEHAPILLGTRSDARAELLFSTCWACPGEGGALEVDADGRPHLSPR